MTSKLIVKTVLLVFALGLNGCSSYSQETSTNHRAQYSANAQASNQQVFWQKDNKTLWQQLVHLSSNKLQQYRQTINDEIKRGWLDLAIISKKNSTNTVQLANELIAWQHKYPNHPARQFIPDQDKLVSLQSAKPPKHIAVLLPQQGTYGSAGQTVREGFLNAYYAHLTKVGEQKIKFYDTSQTQNMVSLYQQAVAEGADVVIGPLVRNEVEQLSNTGSFKSPTLALNYSGTRISTLPQNYYEFGLLPEDEVRQIAFRAQDAGLKNALIIAPKNNWGKRLSATFNERWRIAGGKIQETWFYTSPSNYVQNIERLPKDIQVIFLFSQPTAARAIVPLLKKRYAQSIPIYATASVYSGKPDLSKDINLDGIIVCDLPWNMHGTKNRSSASSQANRLYAVGQDAYLLSQSLDRLETLPNFPLYGSTGALTLSAAHQIHRSIPCNKLSNGYL